MKKIWSLSIDAPFSVIEQVMDHLPAGALGESAFIKDKDDRGRDPLWIVQGFYKQQPDYEELSVACLVLAAAHGMAAFPVACEQVPVDGWLTKNQASYVPMAIGRFVIHDHAHRLSLLPHQRGIEMEVSCAFGTGEHPTTFGCLMALQQVAGRHRFSRVLDIGTGTGVLAIAAAKLRLCSAVASDIDPPSVDVARENSRKNGLARRMTMLKADGFKARSIRKKKPYDLVISNIFARPLARLAPQMGRCLKPGGYVILAGFLHRDVNLVRSAYAGQKIFLQKVLRFGHWSVLILKKRAA